MEMLVLLMTLLGTMGILVYSVLAVWYQKKYPPREYDERQALAQGEAARQSMWIGTIYFLALFASYGYRGLVYDAELRAMEVALAIMVGMEASLLVNHTYCLLKHAALPMNQKPRGMMVSYLGLGVVDLLNYYLRCWLYPGKGNQLEGYLYLIIGVGASCLGVLYLIEWLRQRKEARYGEE
ncbi:MAG: hypothetical protein E7445_01345 [Ruminococcaceae bacterium]|nr:hypothetical protein [Oscillospiraceae bacterium]